MDTRYFRKGNAWLLVVLFLFVGVTPAGADIKIWGDKFTMTGFLRHQLVYNMGHKNPYNSNPQFLSSVPIIPPKTGYGVQDDKNWCNLSRTWFITEWKFEPNDMFKTYSKVRVVADSTTNLDSELYDYDPFQFATRHYGTTMRLGHDEDIKAEIWELYADVDFENLWIRLGKQQVVWGEVPSVRIMDVVNPLDKSWHFTWEPEEFENIRIPLWMARASYTIEQTIMPWLDDLYIEGFWNPGDIEPSINPDIGNPYRLQYLMEVEWGGVYSLNPVEDNRGRDEFGFRLGYRIGQFGGTFNYAYLFSDDVFYETTTTPPIGPPWIWPAIETRRVLPRIEVYGLTLNYAFDFPISLAATIEATLTKDAPWHDNTIAHAALIGITEKDEYDFAIVLQRFTSVFPGHPFMNMKFVYAAKIVEDNEDVKWVPGPNAPGNKNNIVEDITKDAFVFTFDQDFFYKTYKMSGLIQYQPDGAYRINSGFKYSPGDHWRYEVFATWWGGSAFDNANKGYINYFHYQDEIMCRITYQF